MIKIFQEELVMKGLRLKKAFGIGIVLLIISGVLSCSGGGGNASIKSEGNSKLVVSFDFNGKKENAYAVWISTNIYSIKNYHFVTGWDIVIPEAYIILGETVKGAISATLVPVKPLFVSYQNLTNQEVEYIYIRNFPEWFESNMTKNAVPAKPDAGLRESLMKAGYKAHAENFKGNMHYHDYAIILYNFAVSKVKLLHSDMILDWSTWSKKIEAWEITPTGKGIKNDAQSRDAKVYPLDLTKTIPLDKIKQITMCGALDGRIAEMKEINSNFITVKVVGTATISHEEIFPFIVLVDEGNTVYFDIGIDTKKSKKFENFFYKDDYKVTFYAPKGCLPVKLTNHNSKYW
jgi:hypothetical protein